MIGECTTPRLLRVHKSVYGRNENAGISPNIRARRRWCRLVGHCSTTKQGSVQSLAHSGRHEQPELGWSCKSVQWNASGCGCVQTEPGRGRPAESWANSSLGRGKRRGSEGETNRDPIRHRRAFWLLREPYWHSRWPKRRADYTCPARRHHNRGNGYSSDSEVWG